ncbi:MAG: LAGLIDADG family homing endonuclease [Candidatus Hadarchaeota archaeon]
MLFTEKLGLPYGRGKGKKVTIPKKFYISWNILRGCIRGIADTDGCFSLAKSRSGRYYPSIQISTTSVKLAEQLTKILEKRGFSVYFRKQLRKEKTWNTRFMLDCPGAQW